MAGGMLPLGAYNPGMFNFGTGFNPNTPPIADPTAGFTMPSYGGDMATPDLSQMGSQSIAGIGSGLGLNMDTARLGLTGLGTIGNLWAAYQAQKLAKQQFKYTKGITETNLANQIKSYNTTLEDRGRSRAFVEGQSAADAQAYIDKNRLTR